MRKYSTKSASNIYLRDQNIQLLFKKYSPQFRKRKTNNIRATIQNPDLEKFLLRAKKHGHPYLEKNTRPQSEFRPNSQDSTNYQKSKDLVSQKTKEVFSKKILFKPNELEQYSASQMRKREIQMMRRLKAKQYKSQTKKQHKQIQFQYQQRKREQEIKLRRKTSETSFILETHKQAIEFVKHIKHQKVKSELKSNKQLYRQTERNNQFQILKSRVEKMQQSQILTYNKIFLKNQKNDEITLNSSSRLSLKMSSFIDKKLNVLPQIKQKSKNKRQNRNPKKIQKKGLNVKLQVYLSQPEESKTSEFMIQNQQNVEKKQNEPNKIKQEDELLILQNQMNSKKL